MDTTVNTTSEEKFTGCWASIIASVVFIFAMMTAFNLLGLGSGFISLANTDISDISVKPMSLSVFMWLLVTSVITLFIGGWLSGYLAQRRYDKNMGITQGLLTWALSTIILFTTMGLSAGTVMSGISTLASGTLQSLQHVSSQFSLDKLTTFVSNDMKSSISNQFEKLALSPDKIKQITPYLQSYLSTGNRDEVRQKLIENIAQSTGKSSDEIDEMVSNLEKYYDQAIEHAKDKGQQAINAASKAVSAMMFSLFIINLLDAIAGVAGGAIGYRARQPR